MMEAHTWAPYFLALLALIFCGVVGYMVMYDRRQKRLAKDLEREGHPSHSVEEGILLAQERSHRRPVDSGHRA